MPSIVKSIEGAKLSWKKLLQRTFKGDTSSSGQSASASPIERNAISRVSVSATGEGIHTRWVYSEDSELRSETAPATLSVTSSVTLLDSDSDGGLEDKNVSNNLTVSKERSNARLRFSSKVPTASITTGVPTRLIQDGVDTVGTPMVITTSATGEGVHTRWYNSGTELRARRTVRIPSTKQRAVARAKNTSALEILGRLIYDGADTNGTSMVMTTSSTGKGVHTRRNKLYPEQPKEKHIITIPASKKRACPADDDDANANSDAVKFVRRTRARHSARIPAPPCAIVPPTDAAGSFIYIGPNTSGEPILVTTSATGLGKHTHWLYASASYHSTTHASSDSENADDEASSESGSDSEYSAEHKEKLAITIPSLKSLKRSRDSDDDVEDSVDPARRTRSRLSAPLSSVSSLSSCSSSSGSTVSNPSRVICHGISYMRNPYAPSPPPSHSSFRTSARHSLRSVKNSRR
ncbi:hypothetical protein H0H87_007023 [Tephrocybe sp. NHM501043]|nr:hypothetical protein H0H87_007023 [Tephrocybe sp. NHM501043]